MSQQQPAEAKTTAETFEHPSTGLVHILYGEQTPVAQKTLRYPESEEFFAQSRCGNATVALRRGDLGAVPLVVEAADVMHVCDACLEYSEVFVKDDV